MEDMNVTTLFYLSFLRKQESIYINRLLDPRLRGDDMCVGN